MIEIQNIKKSFEDKEVLKGISGTFYKGKTNLIIGSSGTGKSVLLKCIVGLVQPDEGEVLFDNRNFYHSDLDTKIDIRREIGMLFQGSALFDSKTVGENVRFPLDMMTKMSTAEKRDRVDFCLERVGLTGVNQKMPSEISGGMKKRVGIARAIVMNPDYLFCDEPNSGLDPQTSITIDELIQEITYENNMTAVVVTHDMNSVMGIGDHILFLVKGLKVWEGSNNEILDSDNAQLKEFIFASKMMQALKR
ncbi:phospholipid/cholesterol/gamma-HCH transport system ATP-binding protein [Catalinimonas alkaloidigena]|uniref:Phospholipid/cholesterol/gamma-HCH transport system ATP-binding protein n=1 Tax=Catalinimonas alkaloidigena TaxID=1075417 RepID=A0A1G9AYQ7_9BACT|nr:ATP-binding cassette domain-containing protein [Catalinimonas alkaloidigena]SDK32363.1 phospholipid/cholesterol/gamma-HCH transport system ATP-binding protein [Catalinimonas alkaloidigena]